MRVRVLFFGILQDMVQMTEDQAELPAGSTVEQVFAHYAERFETLRRSRPSIVFARNQEFCRAHALVQAGDEIAFLPPVSGGVSCL